MSRFHDPSACIASPRRAERLAGIRRPAPEWHTLAVPAPALQDAGLLLVDRYHRGGHNWRTGRLSRESLAAVFAGIKPRLA